MADCWICAAPVAPDPELSSLGFSRCTRCGFVHRPGVAGEDTKGLYEEGAYETRDFAADYAVPATIEERRRNARPRVRLVARHAAPGGRLLDVGAAGGAFVLEAREAGFDAFGVEPSPAFARHARDELGVDVRDGRLEDLGLEAGSLDALTMWHVLEHVPDPVATLRVVRDVLRDDAPLVLEVPNLESAVSRRMGTAWTHLDPGAHVSQFTAATLRAALRVAGLRPVVVTTVSASTYLTAAQRLGRGPLGERARLLLDRRVTRLRHPDAHELLRAVAVPG